MKQGALEERAKAAETKIINIKVEIHSLQETLRDEQSNVNDLGQYGREIWLKSTTFPLQLMKIYNL